MQEKNLRNVKKILGRLKELFNVTSDGDLTVLLGVSNSTISNWKKRDSIDFELLFSICEKYNFDIRYVIYGFGTPRGTQKNLILSEPKVIYEPQFITINQDNEDVITIVPHKAAAGYLNGYADPEYIETLPTIQAPGYSGGLHRGFEIRGNSMPPLHPGSISVGKYTEGISSIKNRRVYIIVSLNDGIVIKRVVNIPHERKLILISDNPNKKEFPNQPVDYEEVLQVWEWKGALIHALPDPSDWYNRLNDYEARLSIIENKLAGK